MAFGLPGCALSPLALIGACVFTKTQICSHFGISPATFDHYRDLTIIAPPIIDGVYRYYTEIDIRRIRDVRLALDEAPTLAGWAFAHPHPHAPHPADDESLEL